MNITKYNMSILDNVYNYKNLEKNNGRINIREPSDPNAVFKMQERIALKNAATPYTEAVGGIFEKNILSQVYFSAENIKIIQNAIRAGVYKMSNNKFVVAPPNIDNLKIIMRSVYLQYATHDLENIKKEVEKLNGIVCDYAIPATYNEAVGYLRYCEDQSTLVVPLERPLNHDREYKQLELKQWF
jgi:hypothetical protein